MIHLKTLIDTLVKDKYLAILADLTLPDASGTQVVEKIDKFDTPTVVFSGSIDKDLINKVLDYNVMDFVVKDNPSSSDYAIRLIKFIVLNKKSSLLVVDDSKVSRMFLNSSLQRLGLKILEAEDGIEALKIIEKDKSVKLVLTDKQMPNMDGIEFVNKARMKYGLNELAIIGVASKSDDDDIILEFLKSGANDFVSKSTSSEEIFSRVVTNIELLDYIKIAKDSSTIDYLTKLHNRRYLYDIGDKLFANARRKHLELSVCMIDIDYFKKINDRYSHEAGDMALVEMSKVLKATLRESDVITRYGGEEFCIILNGLTLENSINIMEKLRKNISEIAIVINNKTIKFTVSIGISSNLSRSLEDMINRADKALYKAKESGRDKVVSL